MDNNQNNKDSKWNVTVNVPTNPNVDNSTSFSEMDYKDRKTRFMSNSRPTKAENMFYGVDTNNREAVEAEYLKLKRRHRVFTIFAVVFILVLGLFVFDFYNVNTNNKKPIFAIKKRIDNGDKYTGLGYTAIYCDNGDVFIGSVNKDCLGGNGTLTFNEMFYNAFMTYVKEEEYLDEKELVKLDFVSVTFDETNEDGFSDYLVEINYVCSDSTADCFKTFKEVDNQNNIKLYVSINNYNKVYEIKTFKTSGIYYDILRASYEEKLRNYMINNGLVDESNLRLFNIELLENYGRFKYNDVMYSDSYKIYVTYMCNDNSNTCVKAIDGEEYSNLFFEAAMLTNTNDDVALVKHTKIFK
ncbi:MAG: hypothetical protein IJ475_00985 [Bacilli bacterium]|nr:hypothetical protein [Bacilli bacterium]